MDFITRVPIICSIRDYDSSIIDNEHYEIYTNDIISVHNKLLAKLNDDNIHPALIFENEIMMLQDISDNIRNEIFNFITTNTTWDIIVVSPLPNVSLTPISGNISKLNDNTTFHHSCVYFASARFMYKNKINDFTDIQTYVYTNPFLRNMPHFSNEPITIETGEYTVGKLSNIQVFSLDDIRYKWESIHV